jgi:hypothetical protein
MNAFSFLPSPSYLPFSETETRSLSKFKIDEPEHFPRQRHHIEKLHLNKHLRYRHWHQKNSFVLVVLPHLLLCSCFLLQEG